jgi:hypothetical protein
METNAIHDLHALVKEHVEPTVVETTAGHVLVTSKDQIVHDLEAYLDKHRPYPTRSKGTTRHDTLDSLVAHAKRHASTLETAAYCDLVGDTPKLVVVFNDHPGADESGIIDHGGFRDHLAIYTFPVSDAWARWTRAGRSDGLSVGEFAELLEGGIGDVRDPAGAGDVPQLPGVRYASPAELLTLATGLSVRVEQRVVDQRRLDNGTVAMTFSEEHTNDKGEPLRIPGGFLLGIPAFVGGDVYAVPVRLRYRVKSGAVVWILALHDAAGVRRDAITATAERFRTETELPLFFGTPDA